MCGRIELRRGKAEMKHRWAAAWLALGLVGAGAAARAGQVSCVGQIVPGERVVRVAAPVGSIVGELRVARGGRVVAGDVVAVLRDEPAARAQWERTRRQVEVARAELELTLAAERPEAIQAQEALVAAEEAEARWMERRLSRYEGLEKGRHASQDEQDGIAGRLEVLRARLERERSVLAGMRSARAEVAAKAQAALRLAEAQAAEAEALLELQRVRAPMAGEILEVHAWPGEGIWDGGAIASLGETDRMMVLAEVYETDLGRVAVGQRATFRGQAFAGTAEGEVVEIQRMLEGSRVFAMSPSEYVDRRIAVARIRPDDPAALAVFSHAHVTVSIPVLCPGRCLGGGGGGGGGCGWGGARCGAIRGGSTWRWGGCRSGRC